MNATTEQQKRVALAIKPDAAHVVWVKLDQTGQPPRVIDDMIKPRLELVSLDDSPIAIYRADTDESYTRDSLAALAELVQVVNGMPNVSVDVDEQMRQLREQLRATVDNAEEMISNRDVQIDYDEHRIEKIIEQARRWKATARRREEYIDSWKDEDRKLRSAITQRDTELRASRREIAELQDQLQVARNAVDRAVNRSNHSNEHVDRARARAHDAETNAARHAQEAADLRQQLGQATAEAHDLRERIVEVQANALDTINRVAAALPGPVIDAEVVTPDVEVNTWFWEDNVPVVQIDTRRGDDSRLRINLNDGVVWDGNPETDERPGSYAEPEEFSNEAARAADGATISRQLDTIRDQAERIEELQAERDKIRADNEKLREIGETQRRAVNASVEANALKQRFDAVGAYPEQVNAALRIIARGRLTLQDARALVPTDTDPLGVADSEQSRRDALQQRDDLDRKLTESETMRKRLDEQLAKTRQECKERREHAVRQADRIAKADATIERQAQTISDLTETVKNRDNQISTERRVYETASAALRAMIRERDNVIALAAAEIDQEGLTAAAFERARQALPKLEPEADARKDESIHKMIAAVDQAVRFWRRSPANVMTEQLNIALSNLAESIQPNS